MIRPRQTPSIPGTPMPSPIIRPALAYEYDEIARVWMESWVSTGLAEASNFLLANLRARVRHEIEQGWSLYVADDNENFAAMLALHLPDKYLDQLFVAPEYQGKGIGRQLLAFTRQQHEKAARPHALDAEDAGRGGIDAVEVIEQPAVGAELAEQLAQGGKIELLE